MSNTACGVRTWIAQASQVGRVALTERKRLDAARFSDEVLAVVAIILL
jgi:hypothetical protein